MGYLKDSNDLPAFTGCRNRDAEPQLGQAARYEFQFGRSSVSKHLFEIFLTSSPFNAGASPPATSSKTLSTDTNIVLSACLMRLDHQRAEDILLVWHEA